MFIRRADRTSSDLVVDSNEKGVLSYLRLKLSAIKHRGTIPAHNDHVPEKQTPTSTLGEADHNHPDPPAPHPISLVKLFRFSTKTELLLDAVGLIAAAVAGAGQPLLSLFFSNLTQDFVDFGSVISRFRAADPTSVVAYNDAKARLLQTTARDASYVVYVGVAVFVCTYIFMNIWEYTGEINAKRIRERYLQSVLRQEIAFFDHTSAGEFATRIENNTHQIQQGISEKFAMCAYHLSTLVSGLIIAYIRSWRLALALTVMFPWLWISGSLMTKYSAKYHGISLNRVTDAGKFAYEVMSTVRTSHVFGARDIFTRIYNSRVLNARSADIIAAFAHACGHAAFYLVVYACYALAFNFGTTLVLHGQATVGVVVNVFTAIMLSSFSLAFIAPELQAVTMARVAAGSIFTTLDRKSSINSGSLLGQKPHTIKGSIRFQNVDFCYPSRQDIPVLKDLSIEFQAGKTTALVGSSGSGKSTIVNLIERFYDPQGGSILLDDVPLGDLNLKWLRSHIGLVQQEPVLFSTTIRNNIAFGLINTPYEHASDEEQFKLIKEACKTANADTFVSKLPLGYETVVGEKGTLLSGGQKQRIAIARAVISNPTILLFDEATSALDTQNESAVQDALDRAATGRTTIIIAHRLSTVRNADCILVLSNGGIVESGTHDQLISTGGLYASHVASQLLKEQKSVPIEDGPTAAGPPELAEVDQTYVVDQRDLEKVDIPPTSQTVGDEQTKPIKGTKQYGIWYLLKRIGTIGPDVPRNYGLAALFGFSTGFVYPSFGIVYAMMITTFQTSDRHILRTNGDRNALWVFIISVLAMLSVGMQNFLFGRAGAKLTCHVRSKMFKKILEQDIPFFDQEANNSDKLLFRLTSDPQRLSGLAGVALGAILQSSTTVIVGSVIGLIFSWKIALVGIATMPLLLSTGYIRLRIVVARDAQNKQAHQAAAHIACEAVSAIRTVTSLTMEDDCHRRHSQSLEEPLRRSIRISLVSNVIFALSQAMQYFIIALVFWYGSRLVSNQEVDTKRFFTCLFSVTYGAIQAGSVFAFVRDLSSAAGAASDIISLLDQGPKIIQPTDARPLPDVHGKVVIQDLHFRYPTRLDVGVLRGLSLDVKPGSFAALVGESGCGKSTIIQLIERFYIPEGGHIYLDGRDISSLDIQEYRKHLSLVSQEPTLYAGTIRFNILLGAIIPHDQVSQEEIEAACRDANILDFIESLPQGLDTDVGENGCLLSGGQKQRIAIARALIRHPKILLLDEATSALDSKSEKVVQSALDQASRGRTTIAIAHRLSTIQNADCIYFIKDGRISESGTHDHLLSLHGDYFTYVNFQT